MLDPQVLFGIDQLALQQLTQTYGLIQPTNPAMLSQWIAAVQAIIAQYGSIAATVGANAYVEDRVAAGVVGRYTPILAPALVPDQSEKALRYAAHFMFETDDAAAGKLQVIRNAEQTFSRLVAQPARQTFHANVKQDRQATGYARQPSAGACAFCALLGTRGAVYKDEDFATGREYHSKCGCRAVAVFRGQSYQPPEHVREFEELYRRASRGNSRPETIAAMRKLLAEQRSESTE